MNQNVNIVKSITKLLLYSVFIIARKEMKTTDFYQPE